MLFWAGCSNAGPDVHVVCSLMPTPLAWPVSQLLNILMISFSICQKWYQCPKCLNMKLILSSTSVNCIINQLCCMLRRLRSWFGVKMWNIIKSYRWPKTLKNTSVYSLKRYVFRQLQFFDSSQQSYAGKAMQIHTW